MKKLCIFYKYTDKWIGKKIDWIVCKKCQRELKHGILLQPSYLYCDCLELPNTHRIYECKTAESRAEYFASQPKPLDRTEIARIFQVPERLLGPVELRAFAPVHKTEKDGCPDCKHPWIRHGKRAGKICCFVRSLDASGNYDTCGCNTVPPPAKIDVAKTTKEMLAAFLNVPASFLVDVRPRTTKPVEQCETCGCSEFIEAGDCPAGRWWWACAACGKRRS